MTEQCHEVTRALRGVTALPPSEMCDPSTRRRFRVKIPCYNEDVVSLPHNEGLAKGSMAGTPACLQAGADIIVNTDADN